MFLKFLGVFPCTQFYKFDRQMRPSRRVPDDKDRFLQERNTMKYSRPAKTKTKTASPNNSTQSQASHGNLLENVFVVEKLPWGCIFSVRANITPPFATTFLILCILVSSLIGSRPFALNQYTAVLCVCLYMCALTEAKFTIDAAPLRHASDFD